LYLYLLREEHGKLFFSTEQELVFNTFSIHQGRRIAIGTHRIPCKILAKWVLADSDVEDLESLIRLFGGVYERILSAN